MANRDQAAELARAEIANPALGITSQFFAVHKCASDDAGRPQIARIDSETEPGAFHVYLSVQNQCYFYVVVVRRNELGVLTVSWGYWQPRTRVYLGIYCADLLPDEITKRVGVSPTTMQVRGTPMTSSPQSRLYEHHVWELEPNRDLPAGVDERLGFLRRLVEPCADRFRSLASAGSVQLSIVYEAWAGDPQFGGIHLDEKTTSLLAALGASIDIDLYGFGPPMSEDTE